MLTLGTAQTDALLFARCGVDDALRAVRLAFRSLGRAAAIGRIACGLEGAFRRCGRARYGRGDVGQRTRRVWGVGVFSLWARGGCVDVWCDGALGWAGPR